MLITLKKVKIIFITLVLITSFYTYSQDKGTKKEDNFNHWSVELNIGQNKPIRPFSEGYYSSSKKFYTVSELEHIDFGARYMLSTIFGLKLDVAFDKIKNKTDKSLPFENDQYRIGLQGVVNFARILKFETFTNRIGLLVHSGIQISQLQTKLGINKSENDGGILFGITPQIKLTNKLVLTTDFTFINNIRQHFNWDGTPSVKNNNLTGIMYNTSVGLTLNLGGKERHADWYLEEDNQMGLSGKDEEARKRLDDIETMLKDIDKDGVPDYLDFESNTPNGVAVDSRGRFIDLNKNGVPDEMERHNNSNNQSLQKIMSNLDAMQKYSASDDDVLKTLVENGYVNVFFDVNKEVPNSGSTNSIYQIIQYLKKFPDSKIKLTGYADVRGDEKVNQNLSKRRAVSVKKLLIETGISPERIAINPQGVDKNYPKSKTGFDLARRVSIELIKLKL